jgi:hypothetical protein
MELKDFKEVPSEFLNEVEISESDFLNEMQKGTEPLEEEPKEELKEETKKEDNFFEFSNPYEKEKENSEANNESGSIDLGSLLSAELATNLVDTIVTSVLISSVSLVGVDIDKKNVQLDIKERKTLHPIIEKCLKEINFDFKNPFELLAFVMLIIYGSKLMPYYGKIGEGISKKMKGEKPKEVKVKAASKKSTIQNIETPSKYLIKKYGENGAIEFLKNKRNA